MEQESELKAGEAKGPSFSWTLGKVEVVAAHVGSQERWNCAHTGQFKGDEQYDRDVAYLNTQVRSFIAKHYNTVLCKPFLIFRRRLFAGCVSGRWCGPGVEAPSVSR